MLARTSTISVFEPTASWSAKWLRLGAPPRLAAAPLLPHRPPSGISLTPRCASAAPAERQVPGCYALSVTDTIPDATLEQLQEE